MMNHRTLTLVLMGIVFGSVSLRAYATMPLLTTQPVPATGSSCEKWAAEQDEDALYMWGQQEDGTSSNEVAKLRLTLHCLGEQIPPIVTFGSSPGASQAFCADHATTPICEGVPPTSDGTIADIQSPGSDIEGPEECDGCYDQEAKTEVPDPRQRPSQDDGAQTSTAEEVDGQGQSITYEDLESFYTAYQFASLCSERGVVFSSDDIESLKREGRRIELTTSFSRDDKERAWSKAADVVSLMKLADIARLRDGCEALQLMITQLMIAGKIEMVPPKPF